MSDFWWEEHLAIQEQIKEGEVLIDALTKEGFKQLPWKTKRLGQLAFDHETGQSYLYTFWVFVQKAELDEAFKDTGPQRFVHYVTR
jgi:hypothetical protein